MNILGVTLEVFDKRGHDKGIHFMVLDTPTEYLLKYLIKGIN